jgi:hypothetical protein
MSVVTKSLNTEEEMAEYVIHHLLEQNEKSTIDGFACLYRYVDVDGKSYSCAVGCLIHDDYYDESLEDKGVRDHNVLNALEMSHPNVPLSSAFLDYLSTLQNIHDNLDPHVWHKIFIDENGNVVVPKILSWEDLRHIYEEILELELNS